MIEALELRLGSVLASGGELAFSVEMAADGRLVVHVYATSFSAPGRGILLSMPLARLDVLEKKISEAREAAAKLGRLR